MKEKFNPQEWLNKPSDIPSVNPSINQSFNPSVPQSFTPSDIFSEVDTVIARIEAALTDITSSYNDWLNVGFAFAHEFGEAGRSFFQRVSRFYTGYTKTETDKQYDQCLKSTGHGITIRTFFHMAKEAGIELKEHGAWSMEQSKWRPETGDGKREDNGRGATDSAYTPSGSSSSLPSPDSGLPMIEVELPTFPDYIFPTLPLFFQRVVERAVTNEERDILLIGSLVTLSACLHRVYGIYDDRKVYPNLFTFITAQASAGKGKLVFCKNLVNLIHWSKREQCHAEKQRHEVELREYNLVKGKDLSAEKPEKPPELLLFIPANSSSTGVFQLLSDNDGRGLIFETEGDTLAQAFKTDYGNYSDGFRKAFHHETINYYRRTDREYVEIQEPCVSAMLSGTPKQIQALIPSAEDGLSSRFIYYRMNLKPVFKDVFASKKDKSLEYHFNELGKEFYSLYKTLSESPEIQFSFTDQQQKEFLRFFTLIQDKYLELQGTEYMATIRRLGLIAFRIGMIFTTLKILETGDFSPMMECRDEDFHAALEMIRVLVRHASRIFSELPENEKQTRPKNKKEMFMDRLPLTFTHKEFLEIARSLMIQQRTAEQHITNFCNKGLIIREQKGIYTNVSHPEYGRENNEQAN
jgi:hypothetical protein